MARVGRWERIRRQAPRAAKYLMYRILVMLPASRRLAVYCAYWGRGYRCNPAAIYEKARELAPRVRGVWVVKADRAASMPAGVDYVVEESFGYFWTMGRTGYFVNNANFADYVQRRPGRIHLQTHHGTPLKLMGLDGLNHGSRKGKGSEKVLRRASRWDFSVAANPHSAQAWRTAYPGSFAHLEYGYPRNDVLVNAEPGHGARIRTTLGIGADQRTILYAPTQRGRNTTHRDGHLDIAALAEALGPETVILTRTHYFYDERATTVDGAAARVIDVTDHPRIEDLYLVADVLITDYSSSMFDYAILDRPIVVFAADWDEYQAIRGVYFDIFADGPGLVVRTDAELVAGFAAGTIDDATARARRTVFRQRFCGWEDGRASERVVRRVFLGEPVTPPTDATETGPDQAGAPGGGNGQETVAPVPALN